ncbi:MAG: hemerythrin family protein [Spirochaetes bacterium]|nr:hemerythrin family protein [Spirochaetota bacterium]
MAFIDWDKSLSVNVKEIDEQHKNLIGMINDLHTAMSKGKSKEIMGDLLIKMIEYADYHFKTEEELMEKFSYMGLFDHKREHIKFVERVINFNEKYKEGNIFLSVELLNFLKEWLKGHIMGTDKKYSEFFNNNGVY